uniref:Uncharacterized protein n=1 Tax=viral metagenome TaxID=1070528 RepID=A0A6C0C1Z3_9ZZZZ
MDLTLLLFICLVSSIALFSYVFFKKHVPSPSPIPAPTSLPDQTDILVRCPRVKICWPNTGPLQLTHCSEESSCEYGWNDLQSHRAILFHDGDYTQTDLSVPSPKNVSSNTLVIGYYQSAMGLSPVGAATALLAAVQVETGANPSPCALDNFWRSISNITVKQTLNWFVSQAAPFRQMIVDGDTNLTRGLDGGCYASGGYGGNSILQNINMNGNQQWLLRNCRFSTWMGNMWNNVALDCTGDLQVGSSPCLTATINTSALPGGVPPFLAYKNDAYGIVVPKFYASNVPQGYIEILENETFLSLSAGEVFVASEDNFDNAALNDAVNAGLNILFTPGTYRINLQITRANVVIMGIGQPILQGAPAIRISAPGVTLSSLLLESTTTETPNAILLVDAHDGASPESPCRLIDIWVRHGSETIEESLLLPALQDLVAIHQSYTYIDNIWAWRQDHTAKISGGVGRNVAIAQHAIHIYPEASGVTCVGTQAEHSLQSPVYWEGASGTLIFLQVELPYEITANTLVPGLLVTGDNFIGVNLGVYIYTPAKWSCQDCSVPCGVRVERGVKNPQFQNVITVQLNIEGGMRSVIDHVLCVDDDVLGGPTSTLQNGRPVCINKYPLDSIRPIINNAYS